MDDEVPMLTSMRFFLEREGYRVVAAETGTAALEAAAAERPALIVLDIMLPDVDGLEVTRRLRRVAGVPILMVSARGDEVDKVVGLEVGADDYLAKPFGPREFIARVRAAIRRSRGTEIAGRLEVGPLTIDPARHTVTLRGRPVALPRKEFDLLRLLAQRAGEVVPRQELLTVVWGEDFFGEEKTLDVHVSRVRQRLEGNPESAHLIQTVRGVGYRLRDDI
ncbi:MAG TPA: response regulator transcription factor [bacterium]|nr:response regulator transcription factor [bacterium]